MSPKHDDKYTNILPIRAEKTQTLVELDEGASDHLLGSVELRLVEI